MGDLITVTLDESTSAKKQAKTQLKKDSGLSISPVTLLGQSLHLGKFTPETSINSGNDFDGSSAANQSNSLKGNISVSVVQVLPNGNLMVRGEKWLMLNNGNEYIRVTGISIPIIRYHPSALLMQEYSTAAPGIFQIPRKEAGWQNSSTVCSIRSSLSA